MATELELLEAPLDPSAADALFLIARRARWADEDLLAQVPADVRPLLPALLEAASPGDDGAVVSTWSVARGVDAPQRVVLGVLPEACSRHNAPSRSHAVAHLLNKNTPNVARVSVVLGLDTVEYALASVLAAARAWMPYSRKTSGPATRTRTVHLALLAPPWTPSCRPPARTRMQAEAQMQRRSG